MSVKNILLSYSNTDLVKIPITARVTYYFSLLTAIINFLAIIFYIRFASSLKQGLAKNDEQMFNTSFRYLSHNALLFLVTMIMTLLTWSWSLAGGWLLDNFRIFRLPLKDRFLASKTKPTFLSRLLLRHQDTMLRWLKQFLQVGLPEDNY